MLALLLALSAHAADVQLSWSGRLLDSAGGPLSGPIAAELRLYAVPEDGAPVYEEPMTLQAADGYVTAVLGAAGGLDSGLFQTSPLYVAVWTGSPLAELGPRGLLTHAPRAAVAESVRLGAGTTCDAASRGSFAYAGGEVRMCSADGWVLLARLRDGATAGQAATSCATLHEDYPTLPTGPYYLDPDGAGAYLGWCEMGRHDGGWTLVLKANNGDTKRFYNNPNVLVAGASLNAATEADDSRGDHIGPAFSRLVGSELMVMDCPGVGTGDLRGTLPVTSSLAAAIATAKLANPFPNPQQCGLLATGATGNGASVGSATWTHLGLACGDDTTTYWASGSDDGTILSWRDSAGPASTNTAHTVGIAKAGSDGGDDVYNRDNTFADACVMVFWR